MNDQTGEEWTDDWGSNIRNVPDDLIESEVRNWISKKADLRQFHCLQHDMRASTEKIQAAVAECIPTAILMARAKEFHTVEVRANTRGVLLTSEWLSEIDFGGYDGDNVTPFRIISYTSLLDNLLEEIRSHETDGATDHDISRLRELQAFATAILKGVDITLRALDEFYK